MGQPLNFHSTTRAELAEQMDRRLIFNQEDGDEILNVEIYEEIDDWWGFGLVQLSYQLNSQRDAKKVRVKIHSPGGLIHEGFAIRNTLKGHNAEIETIGLGLVASIATVILDAGDSVSMYKNSFYMVHRPWMFTLGESDDIRKDAALLDKMEAEIASVYVDGIEKRGKLINNSREETLSQVREWMANETWFTADEALEAGFIDAVIDDEPTFLNSANVSQYEEFLGKCKHVPPQILNIVKSVKPDKMSKEKDNKGTSILDKFKNLFSATEKKLQEIQNELTAEAGAETETETTDEIAAARELLESQGYTVAETAETETTDEGGEGAETTDPDVEQFAAELEAQFNNLNEEIKKIKSKVHRAGPSGGNEGDGKGEKETKNQTRFGKEFGQLANIVKDYAKQG